jgi:aspartyl-tRNA(Asn)/glutamyl-tRNA(Gln) amidotransferase subunit C
VKINNELLEKLEKLSALKVDESKKDEIISQLSDILTYIDNLNELDTSNLDSYFSTLTGGTPLREDVVVSSEEISKAILNNAPQAEDDFFIVPAIIE